MIEDHFIEVKAFAILLKRNRLLELSKSGDCFSSLHYVTLTWERLKGTSVLLVFVSTREKKTLCYQCPVLIQYYTLNRLFFRIVLTADTMSWFTDVDLAPPIEVFALNKQYNEDDFPNKVSLGVGGNFDLQKNWYCL